MSITLKLSAIKNKDDFSKLQHENTMELVEQNVGKSYLELWEEIYQKTMPGISESKTIALFSEIISEDTDMQVLGRVLKNSFCAIFETNNVLSVKVEKRKEGIGCYIFIFPLKGRVLEGEFWQDETTNGFSKQHHKAYYFLQKKLEETLHLSLEIPSLDNLVKESSGNIKDCQINLIPSLRINKELLQQKEELIYDAQGLAYQEQTDTPKEEMKRIYTIILKYFTTGAERMLFKQAQQNNVTEAKYRDAVIDHIKRYYPQLSERDTAYILKRIHTAVYGNDIIEPLLNDESISDIKILGPNNIRVKVNGKRMTANMSFADAEDYKRFVNGLAIRHGLDLNANAIHVFTDKYSNPKFIMRFNITTNYINSVPYPYLHIRKIRKSKYRIEDLIKYQMFDRETADYLIYQAKYGKGMIFCGKGASGKTTLMNTLLEEIPYDNSALIIQESEELFTLKHPDIMAQHIVSGHDFSGRNYSLQDEAKNGLLTDLDYFIIGEIKGGEALYLLNAAATGHKGWCSVHAASSLDAIDKLADYVMYESKYTKEQAMYMLKELEVIVFMDHFKVTEISQIAGWDAEKNCLTYKTIYKR